jgi:hypothetical protein
MSYSNTDNGARCWYIPSWLVTRVIESPIHVLIYRSTLCRNGVEKWSMYERKGGREVMIPFNLRSMQGGGRRKDERKRGWERGGGKQGGHGIYGASYFTESHCGVHPCDYTTD